MLKRNYLTPNKILLLKLVPWILLGIPFVFNFYSSASSVMAGIVYVDFAVGIQFSAAICMLFINTHRPENLRFRLGSAVVVSVVAFGLAFALQSQLSSPLLDPFPPYPNSIMLDTQGSSKLVYESGKICGWTFNFGAIDTKALASTDSSERILTFYNAKKETPDETAGYIYQEEDAANQSTCFPGHPRLDKTLPVKVLIVLDPTNAKDAAQIRAIFPHAPDKMCIVILARGLMASD